MSNPTPQLATIIDLAFARRASGMRVSLPGRIESYDAATQRATVQPLVMESHTDDLGERVAELLPVVTDVPIMFPGSGAYRITWPVAAGDTVLLVFSSSSLDRWLARGGEVDPEDDRHHNISDAVAIPGLFDFAHVPTIAPTNLMIVHSPSQILLGANAEEAAVRITDLEAVFGIIKSAINGAAVAAGDGGATFKLNLMNALNAATLPTGSQKVLIE